MPTINLDANATYGILPEVRDELGRFSDYGLNPSSIHSSGQRARALIEESRFEVGLLVGCSAQDKIIFTSGATEANNLVFLGLLLDKDRARGNIVTSDIEHPSVVEPARRLARHGFELRMIPSFSTTDSSTIPDLSLLVDQETQLASIAACMMFKEENFPLPKNNLDLNGFPAMINSCMRCSFQQILLPCLTNQRLYIWLNKLQCRNIPH